MTPQARTLLLKIALAFALGVVLTPIVAVIVAKITLHFGGQIPQWHRVATRTFMVLIVVIFAWGSGHPRSWPDKFRAMGLRGPNRLPRFLTGALWAVALFAAIIGSSYLLGGRTPQYDEPKRTLLKALGVFALSGCLVGMFEEILFRGYMKDTLGGMLSAFLYAIVHFFRPMHKTVRIDEFDPLLVIHRFGDLLEGWMVLQNVTFGMLTLFMFGIALNRLRERTGTLYLGIGLHAGIVFAMRLYQQWVSATPNGSRMIWGSNRVHDSLVGFVGMAVMILIAYKAPLGRLLRDKPETLDDRAA